MRLTTEELVTEFLTLTDIAIDAPLGGMYRTNKRQYTFFEVLCAWIDADNVREKAAEILGFKDSKALDNFLQVRKFQKTIGKHKQARSYAVFLANSIGLSYCDSCEEYLPVRKFPEIKRGSKGNGLGNKEYRNYCDDCYGPEYQYAHNNAWKAKNPAKLRSYNSKRRALKAGAEVEVSEEEKKAIDELFDNCPEGYHVDHKIPLSRGGPHTLDNLQYMTKQANLRKGTLTQEEWEIRAKEKGWDVGVLENNS